MARSSLPARLIATVAVAMALLPAHAAPAPLPRPTRAVARPSVTARLCGQWTAWWPDHTGRLSGGDMWLGRDGRFYNVWMGKIYEGRWEAEDSMLYLHVEHLNGLPSCGTYPVSIRRIEPDRMIGDPMSMERKR